VYVKVFQDILDSSIWDEDLATRIVWLTMLIMADEDGVVRASESGVRRRAAVTEDQISKAIKTLLSPDSDSKDQAHDGRRIERMEGGWQVLNYKKYREIRTKKQRKDAERQARWRARHRDASQESQDITANASASSSKVEEPTPHPTPPKIADRDESRTSQDITLPGDPRRGGTSWLAPFDKLWKATVGGRLIPAGQRGGGEVGKVMKGVYQDVAGEMELTIPPARKNPTTEQREERKQVVLAVGQEVLHRFTKWLAKLKNKDRASIHQFARTHGTYASKKKGDHPFKMI
jgi:hypothetical protein